MFKFKSNEHGIRTYTHIKKYRRDKGFHYACWVFMQLLITRSIVRIMPYLLNTNLFLLCPHNTHLLSLYITPQVFCILIKYLRFRLFILFLPTVFTRVYFWTCILVNRLMLSLLHLHNTCLYNIVQFLLN